jgi:hypothetical protein
MRSFEWGEYITGLSHGMGVCLVTLRIQKGSEMKKMFVYFTQRFTSCIEDFPRDEIHHLFFLFNVFQMKFQGPNGDLFPMSAKQGRCSVLFQDSIKFYKMVGWDKLFKHFTSLKIVLWKLYEWYIRHFK